MKELLIRQKIDQIEDNLVQRAEDIVDNCPGITDERKGLEDKQLRNVMAVAAETESLSVVDNFIKYQIGRSYDPKKPPQKWRFGGFGEKMRVDLVWLKQQAQSLAGNKVSAKDLEIRLVRLYLGYLIRHFKYVQVPVGGGES